MLKQRNDNLNTSRSVYYQNIEESHLYNNNFLIWRRCSNEHSIFRISIGFIVYLSTNCLNERISSLKISSGSCLICTQSNLKHLRSGHSDDTCSTVISSGKLLKQNASRLRIIIFSFISQSSNFYFSFIATLHIDMRRNQLEHLRCMELSMF